MMKKNKKNNKGFTLIETLVAVSILSISIVASLVASGASISNSKNTQYQVAAYYLAQEAMEFIKNKRDENALDAIGGGSKTWLTGMAELPGDPCRNGKVCQVDTSPSAASNPFTYCNNAPVTSSSPKVCQYLRRDPVSGLFGYDQSWTPTVWMREIQIDPVAGNPDEVNVIISISWNIKGVDYSFQVSESLFNRQ